MSLCDDCSVANTAIIRYAESNIPVDYWFLDMKNFTGDQVLYKKYEEIVDDLNDSYDDGTSFCFAGGHGVGKTMACACILKRAAEKNFSSFYINLTDIINVLVSNNNEDKQTARNCLLMTDFLVIDEFDQRFIGSANASDLYGRIIEPTLRTRIQNRMPLFLCTNSPNITSTFQGALKQSFSSLMNKIQLVPVVGKDHRKNT